MTLYLVTDDWSNNGWGEDRYSGVYNSRWSALESIRELYLKDLKTEEVTGGEITVHSYEERGNDVVEWVYDAGGGVNTTCHYLEIQEIKLNKPIVDELVNC